VPSHALLGAVSLIKSKFGWAGVAVAVALYFAVGGLGSQGPRSASAPIGGTGVQNDAESAQVGFVSSVLDHTQDAWTTLMPGYRRAKLVLYRGRTSTACGLGKSATGPFYCPADSTAYLDLSFFEQLSRQLGAPGDFAAAYVIAHEIGHHVQNLTGANARVARAPRDQQSGDGGLSVRLELQADCYSGVWASVAQRDGLLEAGDIEEALTAAAAIGDDKLQRDATGTVRPETFSHGTSAQRARWFRVGMQSGDPNACDTFAARRL